MPDQSQLRLALLGGGRMGRALAQGMIRAGVVRPSGLAVADPDEACRQWWQQEIPEIRTFSNNREALSEADFVIVAVKPGTVPTLAEEIRNSLGSRVVISIAAGVTLDRLQQVFKSDRVVRVMPNTPCLVGRGACGYCCGPAIQPEQEQAVQRMLSSVGVAIRVDDGLMDAVTGLSGSGPAFVYLFLEALSDGGVAAGLSRETATLLAAHTVAGAAEMLLQTGLHPGQLKDQVTSPGGTTIAGVTALEQNAFRASVMSAVAAAARRSRELASSKERERPCHK